MLVLIKKLKICTSDNSYDNEDLEKKSRNFNVGVIKNCIVFVVSFIKVATTDAFTLATIPFTIDLYKIQRYIPLRMWVEKKVVEVSRILVLLGLHSMVVLTYTLVDKDMDMGDILL